MPQQKPWHSKRPGETVHHDNTACTEGNNIETHYFAWGTGTALFVRIVGVSIRKESSIIFNPPELRTPAVLLQLLLQVLRKFPGKDSQKQ